MKTKFWALCLLLGSFQALFAQSDTLEKAPSTLMIQFTQDNALGFYPAIFGSVGLNQDLSLTYYGLFWTNPSFGNLNFGTNLWTETGIGLGLSTLGGRLYVNPSVGFTHGRLQSGGANSILAEGMAPSIAIIYTDKWVEADAFFIYYWGIRENGSPPLDYIIYWFIPGIRLGEHFSLGFHYERFLVANTSDPSLEAVNYNWTGAYVKGTVLGKYTLRFSAGLNNGLSIYSDEFYKLTFSAFLD